VNILVTGGNGRLAQKLRSTPDFNFLTPSREELNLSSYSSIDKFLEEKTVDGLILNAFHYLPSDIDLNNIKSFNEGFIESTKVNLLSTLYLYLKLNHNLKFIVFLSTGLDPIHESNHIFYRNSKAAVSDLLERLWYRDQKIKTIFVHPGHMHDDYTFSMSALQLVNLVSKIDELKNLTTYGIFDKDKMQAQELESIKSYHTVNVVDL